MLKVISLVRQSIRLCFHLGYERNDGPSFWESDGCMGRREIRLDEDSWSSFRTRNYTSIKPSDEQANGGGVVLLEMNGVLLSLLEAPVQSFVEVV
jgi:hypothetical protein